MCGIAGLIDKRGVRIDTLQQISRILKHRGPDDEGFALSDFNRIDSCRGDDTIRELSDLTYLNSYKLENTKLGFVHRRLSIIDLEKTGHQPMIDDNGRYLIVFNGEIYNYVELKEELILRGYKFKSTSDTEIILYSYTEWGIACVERFMGMWAFAIYDNFRKHVFLSRDRFGIKPLYYSVTDETFAFASESKVLIETGIVKPRADLIASLEYIVFGALADPSGNLYENIKTVPAGTNIEFDINEHNIKISCYYDLSSLQFKKTNNKFYSDLFDSFRNFFTDSVRMHLRSDVPVGSCLSGGLDSGSLVATASLVSDFSRIVTFTASYPGSSIDERLYVLKLAERYKNLDTRYCYPSFEKFWGDFDRITWHQDYPFNSTSIYSQWEVMKLAKETGIKVLLDGQGADESLGGYSTFAGNYLLGLLKVLKLQKFLKEYILLKENLTPKIFEAISRSAFYYLPGSIQKKLRNKQRAGKNLVSEEYRHELSSLVVPQRGGKSFSDLSASSIIYGLSELLRYEDRNSMAFSVESRVPFLDHRLVEFCLSLQEDFKINSGWTKYILRKSNEKILPEEIVWRKGKLGFVTPQNQWRISNHKVIKSFVNDTQLPSILNREYIDSMVTSEIKSASMISEFWKIISFINWANIFKVTF
jgi:asparagine synthase (glutamine-hydrolysing)